MNDSLKNLEYFIQVLDRDAYEIQMMNKANEQIQQSPDWAMQSGVSAYEQKEYEEVKHHIAETERAIKNVKELIASDISYKAIFQAQLEQLETLERSFKTQLMVIHPERLQ